MEKSKKAVCGNCGVVDDPATHICHVRMGKDKKRVQSSWDLVIIPHAHRTKLHDFLEGGWEPFAMTPDGDDFSIGLRKKR